MQLEMQVILFNIAAFFSYLFSGNENVPLPEKGFLQSDKYKEWEKQLKYEQTQVLPFDAIRNFKNMQDYDRMCVQSSVNYLYLKQNLKNLIDLDNYE